MQIHNPQVELLRLIDDALIKHPRIEKIQEALRLVARDFDDVEERESKIRDGALWRPIDDPEFQPYVSIMQFYRPM